MNRMNSTVPVPKVSARKEEEEEEEAWVLPLGRAAALLEVRRGAHHAAP